MAPFGELALMVHVVPVRGAEDLAAVRGLFRAYADWLGPVLSAPVFEAEFAGLPGTYAPPGGELLLARMEDGMPAGCVALRALPVAWTCEVKRLYVRDAARGTGIGRALMEHVLGVATTAGYRRVVLDTLPEMVAAQSIYRRLGFESIPAYHEEAMPGTLFFGKNLQQMEEGKTR